MERVCIHRRNGTIVFSVDGSTGSHVVWSDKDGEYCTCVGWSVRKKCKHLDLLRCKIMSGEISIDEILNGKDDVRRFPSSLNAINTLFGEEAYNSDEIFAVYGKPKVGKSLLMTQDGYYLTTQGYNVLYIDTEGSGVEFLRKWIPIFKQRFGEGKGKMWYNSIKTIEELLEYVGFRAVVKRVSAGGGKKANVGKLEFSIVETLENSELSKFIEKNKIDFVIVDSISAPLRKFTSTQQDHPAKADATAHLFMGLIDVMDKHNVGVAVTLHACNDDKTEVFVKGKGFVTYKDVNVGDYVLGINEDGDVVWTKVLEKYVYDYDGELIRIKGKSADFLVTGNHRVMLADGSYIYAEMVNRHGVLVPKARLGDKPAQITMDDMFKSPRYALYGWYVAEGCLRKQGNHIHSVVLTLNEKDLEVVKAILDSIGIKYSIYEYESKEYKGIKFSGKYYHVTIFDAELWRELEKFGRKSDEKRIPEEIMMASEEEKRAFLSGLLHGDGHRAIRNNNRAWQLTTVSKRLAEDVMMLAMSLGFAVGMSNGKNNGILSKRERYSIYIRPINYAWVAFAGKEMYRGKIWSLRTETTNYLVRRNNKIAFTGNSWNPANPYNIGAAMRGGIVVHHNCKRVIYVDRREANEFKSYRKFWLVRAEDVEDWSRATVGQITDLGYVDVTDEKIIEKVFTDGEKKKLN